MRSFLRRLAALLRRNRLDDDLAEEIRLHLELRRQALIDSGMTADDAQREARRQFGNVTLVRERTRAQWGGAGVDNVMQDVRYGLRLIRKAPGFSAVAITSLAVGIGASTLLFSFANTFLFRPLHAANPEELIQVFTSDSDGDFNGGSSYADYESFRASPVFSNLLASSRATATLSSADRPMLIDGLLVSGNYFDVLGLRPSHGRFFRDEETRTRGTHPVIVVSHDAWRRRFNEDPRLIGGTIELNRRAFTVIGIGPPRFTGTSLEHSADFFVPVTMHEAIVPAADLLRNRRHRSFMLLGRLQDGLTLQVANQALAGVGAGLLQQDPAAWRAADGRGRVITAVRERKARFAGADSGAVAFIYGSVLAGVAAILTIACVNVATVLLARASVRRKEIAVRLAMGASRRRLIRQLLTECALLAAAGGALGVMIAQAAASLFLRFRPEGLPAFDLTVDTRILIFSIVASLLTVILFGLAPALQATRPDLNGELKGMARTVRVRGLRFGLRAGLVVVQVAISLALLTSAGLMLRSARAGLASDPGFRRAQVLNAAIDLSSIPNRDFAHARFYEDAVRAVAAIPGVDGVVLAGLLPLGGSNRHATIRVADGGASEEISLDINDVGAGYFRMLDIPVLHGREFTEADSRTAPLVALANESMAREFWNGNAAGKSFVEEQTGQVFQIVGVVRDLRHRSFSEAPVPMVYFAAAQRPRASMTLHVRTSVPAAAIGPAVERALRDLDRSAGLQRPETMDEYFERITAPQRLGAAGAAATAVLELALAAMALYGVIAFATSQRRREIGLRMALGASSRSVMALVMREGLLLTATGAVLGIGMGVAAGLALESVLIGVRPIDPISFGGAAVALLLVGAAASYIPARRALAVDPSSALRSE